MADETTFKNPRVAEVFEMFMVKPDRRDDVAAHYAEVIGKLENFHPALIGPIKRRSAD